MERNTELLKQVRQIVKGRTGRHDQKVWYSGVFGTLRGAAVEKLRPYARKRLPNEQAMPDGYCGTTACVAGWAAILSAPEGTTLDGDMGMTLPDGEHVFISDYAREQLGLTHEEARKLFKYHNTRAEVLSQLDALIGEEAPSGTE